nr:immunoglobulin heavy chain junction region [Mus musculus]
CARGGNYW